MLSPLGTRLDLDFSWMRLKLGIMLSPPGADWSWTSLGCG